MIRRILIADYVLLALWGAALGLAAALLAGIVILCHGGFDGSPALLRTVIAGLVAAVTVLP